MVAHRAGNDIDSLRAAEALPVRLVEADIHLFAGRLEVRHLKTVGPLPILWDRWELAPPWAPRLRLETLLAESAPETELMLDLKGWHRALPARLLAAIRAYGTAERVTVCSRSWDLLRPLAGSDRIRVVHSVGSERQLARLRRRFSGSHLDGISIHKKLLDADTVRVLKQLADTVMTWPVATVPEARALHALGVDGVITERFEALAPALAPVPVAV